MKVLISAAETSSDAHAAELLKALRAQAGETVEAFGIGGPELARAGQRQVVDARELLSMGFIEILGRLPKIFSALRKIEDEARREKPEVAVVLDYPDFHFKLAKRLARMGIPLVYYIPPKVWAWRRGRVHFLKRFFKKILCILPFEAEFYRRENVPARYVGSPLQDELPLNKTPQECRAELGLSPSDRVLAVFIGSRPTELKRHLKVFLDGAEMLARELALGTTKLKVLLPFAATSDLGELRSRVESWQKSSGGLLEIRISQGDSGVAMRAADAGLIKSGTSTLEAALLGLPHVIAYKPNELTCFIVKHLIRYRGAIGLSNLVSGSKGIPHDFPELTCSGVTPEAIACELLPLMTEAKAATPKLLVMQTVLERVRAAVLIGGESPSAVAAREIIGVVKEARL
jgi:lipid-A-disaccharide synthase